MSNLIPEKRVNKNGVAVTKHVRPDLKSGSPVKLPAPPAGPSTPRAATPSLDTTLKVTREYHKNSGHTAIPFTLDDLDPSVVQELETLLQNDDAMKPRSYVISSGITSALSQDTVEKCVTYMHNIAVFGPLLAGPENNSISGYISGLNHYSEAVLPPNQDYLIDATYEQREKALELVYFTLRANRLEDESPLVYDSFMDSLGSDDGMEVYFKLKDDELAAYIMEHPEHGDAIIEMMNKEGALPVQLMVDRLNHEVSSLRDGVL